MALVQVDFFSKALMRTVTFNAIVPVDKTGHDIKKITEYKTLYLLHGIFGNHTDWIVNTRIGLLAQEKDLVVIMPAGENKFYVDNDKSMDKFSQFIGEDLVEFTRNLFPLSRKKEDTFIAGLSMGGYGACVTGLNFNETFGHIGMFSAGLVLDSAYESTDRDEVPFRKRSYYESVFGNMDELEGSNKDYKALITNLSKDNKNIPDLYMVCGTEDFLIEQNRDYNKFLNENKIDVYYEEWSGVHDWKFWDEAIIKYLDYLPLEEGKQGIHSGNVD